MAPSRNLLICFDAFGTLFVPRRPVHQQYGEVARALGMSGFSDEDIAKTLKAAYKRESSMHPNFGKAVGMNSTKWFSNVITNTFQPLVETKSLPSELVPRLIHRFTSKEGYVLLPGVETLLESLRRLRQGVVIGVITNSDDRVPDVLTSLGLSVDSIRYGDAFAPEKENRCKRGIDFVIMSFDVGHEKPDKRIFAAAEKLVSSEDGALDAATWQKVYVGDEYEKDVLGACNAGWNAVLVGTQDPRVRWLTNAPSGKLYDMFQFDQAAGFDDLNQLTEWIR